MRNTLYYICYCKSYLLQRANPVINGRNVKRAYINDDDWNRINWKQVTFKYWSNPRIAENLKNLKENVYNAYNR